MTHEICVYKLCLHYIHNNPGFVANKVGRVTMKITHHMSGPSFVNSDGLFTQLGWLALVGGRPALQ
jgi:hypothetical protein